MAIKNDIYGVLSMDELRSMKITKKNVLEVKLSNYLAVCLNCGYDKIR